MYSHGIKTLSKEELEQLEKQICQTIREFERLNKQLKDPCGLMMLVASSNSIMMQRRGEEERKRDACEQRLEALVVKLMKALKGKDDISDDVGDIRGVLLECSEDTMRSLKSLREFVRYKSDRELLKEKKNDEKKMGFNMHS